MLTNIKITTSILRALIALMYVPKNEFEKQTVLLAHVIIKLFSFYIKIVVARHVTPSYLSKIFHSHSLRLGEKTIKSVFAHSVIVLLSLDYS
jgi:hypothetical protein